MHSDDAPRARMPWRFLVLLLLAGDGRPGQYELPVFTALIHKVPYGIPQDRKILPFINQARRGAFQKDRRLGLDCRPVFIHVVRVLQLDDAFCVFFSRTRLSTPFGALDQDGSHAFKIEIQNAIYHSFSVFWPHRVKSLLSRRTRNIISDIRSDSQCHFHFFKRFTPKN